MNYGIPDDLPRRQLYNNNDDAAAAAAAAMAGRAFIPEAAEPTQLPSAINFGMPASLTGMEGEGEGGGMGYKTMGYRRMLRGSSNYMYIIKQQTKPCIQIPATHQQTTKVGASDIPPLPI